MKTPFRALATLVALTTLALEASAQSATATAPTTASDSSAVASVQFDSTAGLCSSRSARHWCWGIYGGATEPLGSYSRYSGLGLHLGLLMERVLSPHWRVRADAAYQGLHARDNGSGAVFYEPNVRMATADAVWEATDEHSGPLHPYLTGGFGLYQLRLVQTCYAYCNVNPSGSTMAAGVNGGGGVRIVFPGHWNASGFTAFVEGRWNQVFGAVSPSNDRRTSFVPISIGFLAR